MRGNILVVDDDPNVVEIITESLNREGYRTESAFDGEEALEKFVDFDPDLVILDTVLPKLDGFKVCARILNDNKSQEIPIVMMSNDIMSDAVLEGLSSGARDVIRKPFSIKEVVAKINSFLLQAHGNRRMREKNQLLETEILKGQENYDSVDRELKRKILYLRTLFDLSQDLNRLQEPSELIHVLCLTFIGQLGIGSLAIFNMKSSDDLHLVFAGGMGVEQKILRTLSFSKEGALVKYLMKREKFIDLEGNGIPSTASKESKFLFDLGFKYCFPLIVKSNLVGLILAGAKISDQDYSKSDLEMFTLLCHSAANGLENARLYSELQRTYLSTIKVLVSTIEAKDPYTRGHTERVASYANLLALEMKLDKKEQETVRFGAALHDIGKLGVYENILNKSSELTENEWKVIKSHPEIGANIIKDMKFLESACDLVRHHHERLDGTGYPDGLSGEEISVGARIVAIADSFDAMTSNRPYRKALSFSEAMEQLKFQADKFDPEIIEHLVRLIRCGRIKKSSN